VVVLSWWSEIDAAKVKNEHTAVAFFPNFGPVTQNKIPGYTLLGWGISVLVCWRISALAFCSNSTNTPTPNTPTNSNLIYHEK
jgi:hypothetical protein